jgi:hypothetical protein
MAFILPASSAQLKHGEADRHAEAKGDPPAEPVAERPDPDLGGQPVAALLGVAARADSHSAGESSSACSTRPAGSGSSRK